MGYEIRGLDRLLGKLEAIPGLIETAAVQGVNKTGYDITTEAKNLCPVDSGQLRDSLEPFYETHKAKDRNLVVTGSVGTDVEHGIYEELGTGPVGESTPVPGMYPGNVEHRQTGWTYYDEKHEQFVHTNGQPAQPFLYPAEQAHAQELPENIKTAAEAQLKKVAK